MPVRTGKPIVVGVDDSAAARYAVEWAAEEALARDCDVHAVRVWSVDLVRQPPWAPVERIRAEQTEELSAIIAETIRRRRRAPRIVPVIVEASPAAGLIEASAEAALLVVARRAGRWVRRALLGSVSSACVKHARVPVVVVPPPFEDTDEWLTQDVDQALS